MQSFLYDWLFLVILISLTSQKTLVLNPSIFSEEKACELARNSLQ